MKPFLPFLKTTLILAALSIAYPSLAGEHHHDELEKNHKDEHDHHDHHPEEKLTHISEAMAKQLGITTATAAAKQLQQFVVAYGDLNAGPEQLSHVRARYTGLIKSVKSTIGDKVTKGALLAEVESNESLKAYPILAPISGTVIQRHANKGEVTQDQVLFSIANFDTLWLELRIYPKQLSLVKTGQTVYVSTDGYSVSGKVQHIIPALDKPYQLARININNPSQVLTSGLWVEGRIVINTFTSELAVENIALQTLEDEQGVFTKQGEKYHFTPLQIGRSDDRFSEVLSGLLPGQIYVNKNSYLIKTDIEKSAAEHHH